ncbi:hypothetical protein B5F40_09760 [Gordonibacter sp. An230]|uniref:DUF4430 domain-containing protein n=1 Tax=Gordonibacter sp. An230 TaxID=1965592 RepID=UPI000B39CA68|nr:DUF4430 domain-containing protein [Gordonibacter sp. An230]OUO89668.1 hypothetical protein B5F40_09760 [Gordonibacter sp. An230]
MTHGDRKDSAAAAALSVGDLPMRGEEGSSTDIGSCPQGAPCVARRMPSARKRIAAGAVAAASALIIVFSVGALFGEPPTVSDWSAALQTTAEVAEAPTPSADAGVEGTDVAAGNVEDGGAVEDPASAGADDKGAAPDSAGAVPAEHGVDAPQSADGGQPSPASGSGGPSSDGGAGLDGAGGGAAEPAASVAVRISVDSGNVGSPVSYSGTLSFEEGATVYDALCGTGLALATQWNPLLGSLYVSSIGGLAERHAGYPGSGWKYFVNGAEPGYGCNAYVLSDGDSIVWKYVLSSSEGL